MNTIEEIIRRTGWRGARIGELFDIQQGKALSGKSRGNGMQHPFLRTRNIDWGSVNVADVDAMAFSPQELTKLQLVPGDLLCCEGGDIGRTAVWRGELDDCFYQNHVHRLRRTSDDVHPEYVRFWMEAAFRKFGVYEGAGNKTTIPNLSAARLKQLEVPLPALAEQERIAAALSTIEGAAKIHRTEQRLLQEAFSAALDAIAKRPGDEWSDERSRRMVRLGDVARLYSGGTPPKGEPSFWTGSIPWVSPKDMKQLHLVEVEDHISAEGAEFSRIVPANAVLVVIRGMILAKDIPVAIADVPVAFNQDMKAIVAGPEVDPLFLLYAILSQRHALVQQIGTSAHGTRRLGSSAVENLLIPLPTRDEQLEISRGLDALWTLVDCAAVSARLFSDAYDHVLSDLLSGAARVPTADMATL